MYANILAIGGRKCFSAIHVQQGDAFPLLSTSSNAIPLNLCYTVACAAFPGMRQHQLSKVGINKVSSCKGKKEIQRERK